MPPSRTAMEAVQSLDPLMVAQSLLRRRKMTACSELCTQILERSPYDKAAWFLKTRAETELVYTDEIEMEDEGMAEVMLDDHATAEVARPGTSFKRPVTGSASGASQGIRPMSKGGRPVSGYVRPGTNSARPQTVDQALRTPRTATARPVTSASGRYVRLGTASMLQGENGLFIDTNKMDLAKYAKRPSLSKALFQYMIHVTNDTVKALDLAAKATEACDFKDWWWKAMIGVCYYRLNMFRDAEKQFLSSLKNQNTVLTSHLLAKVYIRLDQPQNALDCYKKALEVHTTDTSLMAAAARVFEGIGEMDKSVLQYKQLLALDSTNGEAIASLAAHYFYNDQPEKALLLYRRLLQMGMFSAELFNNLGLCCFYAQQFDMALGCFERALGMAEDDAMADVWYNLSHIAIGLGDVSLCYHCLKLAVCCDPTHAEAYNNLGTLEHSKKNHEQARAHYTSAQGIHESQYNSALLASELGDFKTCFNAASEALETFPDHVNAKVIFEQLRKLFLAL